MKRMSKQVTTRTFFVTGAAALAILTAAVSRGVSGADEERRASDTAAAVSGADEERRASRTAAAAAATGAAQTGQPEFKSTVRVFIHPDDIYPRVARVRPGKVIISAENNTQTNVTILVGPALSPGQAVGRLTSPVQEKRSAGEFTLAPGEYVFYEQSRPRRQGRLIVR